MSKFKYKIISLRGRNNQRQGFYCLTLKSLSSFWYFLKALKTPFHSILSSDFWSHYSKTGKSYPTIVDQMKLVWGQNNMSIFWSSFSK